MNTSTAAHPLTPRFTPGGSLPISALGPDCFREVVQPQNNNNIAALLVRRDETHTGWAVSVLPAMSATVTCGGSSMTGSANWSNFAFGGIRYGLLDISSIYNENFPIHVSYTYETEVYTEDFPAGNTLSSTDLRDPEGTLHLDASTGQPLEAQRLAPRGQTLELASLRIELDEAGALVLRHVGSQA